MPHMPVGSEQSIDATAELRYWQTQAALLDPNAYVLHYTDSGQLDLTVPEGERWFMVNTFAVYFNTPTVFAQDEFPLTRRSGMLRWIDCRKHVPCAAGTRIRINTGVNVGYVYYCNPSLVIDDDDRYSRNPRGLYYERMDRLWNLPTRELICEATGGGSIADEVHVDIPTDFDNAIVTMSGVLDACWALIGILNTVVEINNTHTTRMADAALLPFRRNNIGGTTFSIKKGTISDGYALAPVAGELYSSFDADTAFPLKGAGYLTYCVLPEDW